MRRFLFVWLLVFLLLVTGVFGVKPSTASSSGITIVFPSLEFFPSNDTAVAGLHFHIFNSSSGLNLSSGVVNCSIHIYNNSDNHITRAFLVADGDDMEFYLPSNVTGRRGFYSYIVWCNSTGAYGWVESNFVINYEGESVFFDGGWAVAVFICLLPFLFGWLLFKWSDDWGEAHFGARFGARLFAIFFVPFATIFLVNLTLLKYFIWDRMVDALGRSVWLIGGVLILLLFYFLIVLIKDMFADVLKHKRRED